MRTGLFFTAKRWERQLQALGFTPTGGAALFCRQDTVFSIENGWGLLRREWQPWTAGPWTGQLGHRGLWKQKLDRRRDQVQPRFEFPPAVLQATDPRRRGEEGEQLFEAAIGWALGTVNGSATASWQPPASDLIDACLPPDGLTVQVGPVLRQGLMIREPERLAMRFPLVARVPDDLPPGRSAWLEALMVEGNNRWRMVRVGRDSDSAYSAEVDLTGVPHTLLESFLRTGLVALRYTVEALVRQADFLADGDAVCRALEVHTPRA